MAIGLNNIAGLLQNQPNRLPEAQQFAEQALAIDKTLEPATAQGLLHLRLDSKSPQSH